MDPSSRTSIKSAWPLPIRGPRKGPTFRVEITDPPRMAIPWVSEAITSCPKSRAHSVRIRVRNRTPCPPLPVMAICIFIEEPFPLSDFVGA